MSSNAELARDFETRRRHNRVFCAEQNVKLSIRLRGELRSHRAELLDISAIGAAVALTRPLAAERTAFLTLTWGDFRIKDVVCTISNCLQTSKTNALLTGYRCGLSFRPSSSLQLDRHETVARINELADALAEAITDMPTKTLDVDALIADTQPVADPLPPSRAGTHETATGLNTSRH